ncbi:hypothetical protein CONPUDRAFT_60293 [Coniophora puteana RWD-64-598 SS2]|uniref:CxC5 like cysteine cluster associated with KDZ domain-containing protein n=1 Tax=Coniophora puteana (strain RWD-64-598) TaxID=741705 RepID=A0A5M3MH10_CONPW|nr:uncharacterized protein CONPUDRAFT_60293 [Coniophora puteana RWD-64-598 SS2]EIW78347.1 hypothetical protein CONPUDRAFT_60293 [Coniophora puteana RWD-64-598 SS2]
MSIELAEVARAFTTNATLAQSRLSYDDVLKFLDRCCEWRDDFATVQPAKRKTVTSPPPILPLVHARWLSNTLGIRRLLIHSLWDVFKHQVWQMLRVRERSHVMVSHIEGKGGWKIGLAYINLYPPSRLCKNLNCAKKSELRQLVPRRCVAFTIEDGVQFAKSITLTCDMCGWEYHPNYVVCPALRRYYLSVPDFIEVDMHHYVETRLANLWTNAMLYSAYVCYYLHNTLVLIYNLSRTSATEQVWTAFTVFALLRDAKDRKVPLRVPHKGEQRDRFKFSMKERNERIIRLGQHELRHYCDLCMRVWREDLADGGRRYRKCQVAVSDGITIGHYICKVFRCTDDLGSMADHFCAEHKDQAGICAVEGCKDAINRTLTTTHTCSDVEHQSMEEQTRARGKSMFALRSRLARAQTSRPEASLPENGPSDDVLSSQLIASLPDDSDEFYELDSNGNMVQHVDSNPTNVGVTDEQVQAANCPDKTTKRFKIHLSRRRSCCEETVVRPCGVIVGRGTLFGAEAVSNVLVLFCKETVQHTGAQKPEHWIYDTACDAKQQAMKDPWWDTVRMSVDVFHLLNKHKTTHAFCQLNCNPVLFPELHKEDGTGWWFNTSIAEQVNVWLGSYHAMVREMMSVRYNFFLDEMIRLRNIDVVERLRVKGHHPNYSSLNE